MEEKHTSVTQVLLFLQLQTAVSQVALSDRKSLLDTNFHSIIMSIESGGKFTRYVDPKK